MAGLRDIAGQRFGRLVAVSIHSGASKKPRRNVKWLCRCDCGAGSIVHTPNLLSGNTQSCGCLWRELLVKHGHSGTHVYDVWAKMLQRCSNPNVKRYRHYGGRGVRVCERWLDFRNFYADMGPRPNGYSIERVNNDGNYEPSNCKWIPLTEQHKNQRMRNGRYPTP